MNSFTASFIAGFIATVVISVIMVIQSLTGVASQATFIGFITQFANEEMQALGSSNVGWGIHFFVGVVIYGLLYSLSTYLTPRLSPVVNAIVLALVFWLIMMLVIMPFLGEGWFGMKIGLVAPLLTLIIHLIFGTVLGVSYRLLHKPRADTLP